MDLSSVTNLICAYIQCDGDVCECCCQVKLFACLNWIPGASLSFMTNI